MQIGHTGKVVGIDPDPSRIAVARNLCVAWPNVELHVCKSIDFPYSDGSPYDYVITNAVLHWIKSDEKLVTFERIFRSLKPGGIFLGNMTLREPTNLTLLFSLLEEKLGHPVRRDHLNMEDPDWIKLRLEEVGFEVLKFEVETYYINVGSLENYAKVFEAAFYGQFDFLGVADHRQNWLKFDDGGMKHDSEVVVFLVRKPFL